MAVELVQVFDENDDVQFLHGDVVRAFAAVGLVWQEGTRWRIDSHTTVEKLPELAVCDFCSGRPVTWDIEADDFTTEGLHSIAGWTACEPCGEIIQRGNREQLAARVRRHIEGEIGRPLLDPAYRRLLDGFWNNYRSIARRETPYR